MYVCGEEGWVSFLATGMNEIITASTNEKDADIYQIISMVEDQPIAIWTKEFAIGQFHA